MFPGWQVKRHFTGGQRRFRKKYPEKAEVIQTQLEELANLEKQQVTEPDAVSRPFGTLMAELFCYKKDPFENTLRRFGFFLGKYIYFLDAFMDLEKDRKKGSFNPFLSRKKGRIFQKMYWIYWKERCAQRSWNLKNYRWNRM